MKQRIGELLSKWRERISLLWQRDDAWSPFDADADARWQQTILAWYRAIQTWVYALHAWCLRLSPRWQKGLGASIVALALAAVAYPLIDSLTQHGAKAPFALIEVRAVDQAGHPVAGASVDINHKAQGVTDSFGEWRRFLRLSTGQVLVRITKPQGNGYLVADKTLLLPELSHTRPAELLASATLLYQARLPAPVAPLSEPSDDEDDSTSLVDGWAKAVSGGGATKAVKKVASPAAASEPIADPIFEQHLRVSLPEVEATDAMMTKLIPALRQVLSSKGIVVAADAPWLLKLAILTRGGAPDMIEMRLVPRQGSGAMAGMLAGYDAGGEIFLHAARSFLDGLNTPGVLAQRRDGRWQFLIPRHLTQQMAFANGDVFEDTQGRAFSVAGGALRHDKLMVPLASSSHEPCEGVTPCYLRRQRLQGGEKNLRFKMVTNTRRGQTRVAGVGGVTVYVGGRLARPVGPDLWEFRATPSQEVYVTLVRGGSILGRERIVPSRYRLPSLSVANDGSLRRRSL